MNVEYFLHQKIGDIALKIHTGRSRNDQVATDTRLWTKKSAKEISCPRRKPAAATTHEFVSEYPKTAPMAPKVTTETNHRFCKS